MRTLPYYLRVAGAELKYLSLKMAAFDPTTLPAKIKGAFSAAATGVKSAVTSIAGAFTRGIKSAWSFSTNLIRSTASWTVKFAQGIGMVVKQLGLLAFNFIRAAAKAALFGVRMLVAKAAMIAQSVATGVVTAAQWALNIAMNANPIGLIITAVGVLIAGIILLYKNWDSIWSGIQAITDKVWNSIKAGWDWIVVVFRKGWKVLQDVFEGVGSAIAGFFSSVWSNIKSTLISTANWIINKLNGLLGGIQNIAGLVGIEIPLIPTIKTADYLSEQLTPKGISAAFSNEDVFAPPTGGSIVSNAITNSRSQTVSVDHSIRDLRFEINASGQDTKSIKEQLLEVFDELAAQGEGIEGVVVNA